MENVINDWGSSLLSVDTWVGTDNLEDVVPSSAYDEEYEESVWNVEMQQLPENPLSIPPTLPVRPENPLSIPPTLPVRPEDPLSIPPPLPVRATVEAKPDMTSKWSSELSESQSSHSSFSGSLTASRDSSESV